MMKWYWDNKYDWTEFIYWSKPNEYFSEKILELKPWKILLPWDWEWRNWVFAAKIWWDVYSLDWSSIWKQKAENLANKNNVKIDYKISSFKDASYQENFIDCIVLTYTHFINHGNNDYSNFLNKYLKKWWFIIFEWFSKSHLWKKWWPKNIDMLYSLDDIKKDFESYKILELKECDVLLNEWSSHSWESTVIRLFWEKNKI